MKREFLTALKVGDRELSNEVIEAIMAENGKDVEAERLKYADYDGLKTQLSEAGKTIEGFKSLDIEGIKKSAEDYKLKAEKAEKDAVEKIAAT